MPIVDTLAGGQTAASIEVYWKEHRFQHDYARVDNTLVRYTLHAGDAAPLLEVWDGAAWASLGGFQLQAYSGSAYTVLPLQSFKVDIISPDQVTWHELRYDAAGTTLVRVSGRLRRGSPAVEFQVVVASGQGLAGPRSIGLVSTPAAPTQFTPLDSSAVIWTNGTNALLAAFLFLTQPAAASTVVGTSLYSGLQVQPGGLARFAILGRHTDAMYAAFAPPGTPAAPAVAATGGTGATSYGYEVVAIGQSDSPQSAAGTIANGRAFNLLDGAHYNAISWTAVPGATAYKVLRTVGGTTQGVIATLGAGSLNFNDTGVAAVPYVANVQQTAYVTRWAQYNRVRVLQRLMVR